MKVVYGQDANVAKWVADRIPHVSEFGLCSALGVVNDKGEAVAGIVFHDYQPSCSTIQISMAASTPKWASRSIVKELLSYPFNQLKVRKVWTATPLKNQRAIKFNKGIGFKQEAVLSNHFGDDHAVICRMFKKQFEQLFKE
jgi:RimJ/RimL family protein N-acetyltransferase